MELYFCWDDGNPRFYDPVTGEYLGNMREVWEARQDAETRADAAEIRADAAETQRDDALSESEQLRAEVAAAAGGARPPAILKPGRTVCPICVPSAAF